MSTISKIKVGGTTYDIAYPVGSIYLSVNSTSPAELFGGTWEQIKDRFMLAAGDTYPAGSTGGEAEHVLTEAELPRISAKFNLHGSDNGSIFHDIYDHATGSKRTNMYKDASDYTGSYSYVDPGIAFGGSQSHNNMPPYLSVYMWKRIA